MSESPYPVLSTDNPKKEHRIGEPRDAWLAPEGGLTTLGQPRLSEGAQPYPLQRVSAQGETGDRRIGRGIHFQVSGLGLRESGTGYLVQVRPRGLRLNLKT